MPTYFITGTDTHVGKTYVTCALLNELAASYQLTTIGYKPVASGTFYDPARQRYINQDACKLQQASNVKCTDKQINPYCFNPATSPHIASKLAHNPIKFSVISQQLHQLQNLVDVVLVEGAGGWFTPLTDNMLFSDWVIAEKLPVIIVISLKIGCINHALLTQQAITQAGLTLIGWVLNYQTDEYGQYDAEYQQTLKNLIKAPLLGIVPYSKQSLCDISPSFNLKPLVNK